MMLGRKQKEKESLFSFSLLFSSLRQRIDRGKEAREDVETVGQEGRGEEGQAGRREGKGREPANQ